MGRNEKLVDRYNRKGQQRNAGFALAAMLCAVVILFIMGAAVLSLGMQSRALAVRTSSGIKARAAADAGLTKTIFQMNEMLENRTWDSVELQYQFDTNKLPYAKDESLPYCEATYDYKVAPTDKKNNNEFVITCSGKSGNSVKTVHAIVKVKSIFDSALLVKDRISLMPKSLVDGYNSADPFDSYINLKIGTTSTLDGRIPLGPGTVVNGDIFVGVNGDPQRVIGAGGSVNGAIIGNNITFKSGSSFYYDEALQDAAIYEEAVRFAVTFWQDE